MTLKEQIEKKRKRNREYKARKRVELKKNITKSLSPIKNKKKHENNIKKLLATVSPIKNKKKHENNMKKLFATVSPKSKKRLLN